MTCFGRHGVSPWKPNCRMHRRSGPVIRSTYNSRPSHLFLPEVLIAKPSLRVNQPIQRRLSTIQGQFLSASIQELSLSVAAEGLTEGQMCNQSAFSLNCLSLEGQTRFLKVADRSSNKQIARNKILRPNLTYRLPFISCERSYAQL